MNDVKIFENKQFGNIRTLTLDSEPWFVLKDICETFGETNYRRVSGKLDDTEKGVSQIDTPGGSQNMIIINESGLYSALFAMQPEKARGVTEEYIANRQEQLKAFKRWITHDVIPSIRKHGAYMTPDTIEKILSNPDTIISLAQKLKEEQEKVRLLETANAMQTQEIEAARPKVTFADAVAASPTSILIGDLAKVLRQNGIDTGERRLFSWFRDNGYLMKSGNSRNLPTQRAMEMGLFEIKESTILQPDGRTRITQTTKVTGKGQQYFISLFLKACPVM